MRGHALAIATSMDELELQQLTTLDEKAFVTGIGCLSKLFEVLGL